jgi:hypothetical protein
MEHMSTTDIITMDGERPSDALRAAARSHLAKTAR